MRSTAGVSAAFRSTQIQKKGKQNRRAVRIVPREGACRETDGRLPDDAHRPNRMRAMPHSSSATGSEGRISDTPGPSSSVDGSYYFWLHEPDAEAEVFSRAHTRRRAFFDIDSIKGSRQSTGRTLIPSAEGFRFGACGGGDAMMTAASSSMRRGALFRRRAYVGMFTYLRRAQRLHPGRRFSRPGARSTAAIEGRVA